MQENMYANGRIYKIISDQTDRVYIGSTCGPTKKRMASHRSHHKMYLAGKFHKRSAFDILQYDDAQIVLVENCACTSKEELHKQERFHIENTPNCVNKSVPGRTLAEYYQDNKEAIRESQNQKNECECGGKYTIAHYAVHNKTKKHLKYIAKKDDAEIVAA